MANKSFADLLDDIVQASKDIDLPLGVRLKAAAEEIGRATLHSSAARVKFRLRAVARK